MKDSIFVIESIDGGYMAIDDNNEVIFVPTNENHKNEKIYATVNKTELN